MDISREHLTARFRELSDQELLDRFQSDTLTPLAHEVAGIELRSRGIDHASSLVDKSTATDDPPIRAEADLVTVAQFWNPIQANLVRSLLESEGIFVHMWGEHLGTAHMFLSVASGGVRVQVPAAQAEQAKEVIAAFERGDFSIEEQEEHGP